MSDANYQLITLANAYSPHYTNNILTQLYSRVVTAIWPPILVETNTPATLVATAGNTPESFRRGKHHNPFITSIHPHIYNSNLTIVARVKGVHSQTLNLTRNTNSPLL